ncbi:MAG: replicative DNA helicase [Sterolibacterium sp.]|nr:replicative DNA helicase [Sterolibacterium sp.]
MTIALPPHSIEAEQSLIGGLLLDARAWDRIADVVGADDFYRDDHRRIFRHISLLAGVGKAADVVTVFESIEKHNEVEQAGGLAYLSEIANNTASAANIRRYAEIVHERAVLRRLVVVGEEIAASAFNPAGKDVRKLLDQAESKLLELAEHGPNTSEPSSITEVLSSVAEQIQARYDRDGEISGLPTGLADLDAMLDGLKGGDLIVIAGRPSMGKTALAINIAENVALAGKPALVFSLEMGDTQLATRSLSSLGGINGKRLASGRMNNDDWDRMTAAIGRLYQVPLYIDQSASLSVSQMRIRARRQMRKTGLALVVIDYLQLMRGEGNNRNEELGDITRGLKLMARDLDVPVILLSQLSRKCEERMDKRPMLSDLRESGAIEQDADVVAMIYRDDYYNPGSPYAGLAEVLVRKNRMGECGNVQLVFQPEFSRFRDADRNAIAEAAQRAHEAKPVRQRRGFNE